MIFGIEAALYTLSRQLYHSVQFCQINVRFCAVFGRVMASNFPCQGHC